MKVIGIFLTAILLFTACNKDDILELLPEMSATIDDEAWNSVTRVTVEKDGNFVITGTSSSGEVLIITILGNTTGNYELSLTAQECGAVLKESIDTDEKDALISATGSVNLSEVNTSSKTISGTFNFTVADLSETRLISNGKFSKLKYTVQNN